MKRPTLKTLEKKLDRLFSLWVRKSRADSFGMVECVSCGKREYWKAMNAGHYIKRQNRSTRWLEVNVHPQCVRCNKWLNGNLAQYSLFLTRQYGPGILEELEELSRRATKYARGDLESLIRRYETL